MFKKKQIEDLDRFVVFKVSNGWEVIFKDGDKRVEEFIGHNLFDIYNIICLHQKRVRKF